MIPPHHRNPNRPPEVPTLVLDAMIVLSVLAATAVAMLLNGCTVAPQLVPAAAAPSWQGNAQDSGVKADTPAGVVVSAQDVAEYNGLVAIYGRAARFVPALVANAGISRGVQPNTWVMADDAFVNFCLMQRWKKSGRLPPPK